MKHAPTLAAIEAAELKMETSRRETREGVQRVQRAFRETVTRPSTLAAAGGLAGLAGLAGFLLARRPRQRARSAAAGTGVVVASSLAAIARLAVSRYGVRGLTLLVRQLRKQWERRNAARNTARNATAGASSNEYPATTAP